MVKRNPVTAQQNRWFDSEQVDDTDLILEQDHNTIISSSIIGNHIGSGVLPEVLVQNILFDSSLFVGYLDGIAVSAQNQPVDNNFGNQLEITLSNSIAAGKKSVKIAIIGLDFQSNLQYETFYFKCNETQISKKHFTKILVLLFNDFIGNPNLSFNLAGNLIIKEANPMTLSRSPLMVAQDLEPNLFFRDFFVDGFPSLQALLNAALPLYNVDSLNISVNVLENKSLLKNDVTTQIGQKFLATTNNIQKITLLLSADLGGDSDLIWNGDLIVSIFPLQSGIDCPTDIAPNLPIDFSPANIPVAQVSFSYATLAASGIILDSVPQPVDFIFSNSPIASGNILKIGAYYATTIKRGGSANKCNILVASGSNRTNYSRITIFTGSLWVDIPEQDLWFKIFTDAAKVSDGKAYESGHGITLSKTSKDVNTLTTVDFCQENLQFTGNDVFRAVVSASVLESAPIPDQKTGNPVLSRQEFIPQFNLYNTIDITNLEASSEPLIIGAITDKNRKFYDSLSSKISSKLYSSTLINDELIIRIVDDPTDGYRFDTSVNSLQTNLLNGDFIGAKIIPDNNNPSIVYRISDSKLCSMITGDVNGDGIVDATDLDLLNTYLGTNLNVGVPAHTSITTDGYHTTYKNGYVTDTQPFANLFSVSFQLVNAVTNAVVATGSDGVLVASPLSARDGYFTSASVTFNTIIGLSSYKLVILSNGVGEADWGGFDITGVDAVSDVLSIKKVILTGESISQMLRADIDGDFHITSTDGYILNSYINREVLTTSPTTIYPAPATNPYTKIGTKFNVIKFKLEKYIDRTDDYAATPLTRSTTVHTKPNIFVADGYFASHDFLNNPSIISIEKQLTWDDSLIVANSRAKLVPSIFGTLNGFNKNSCDLQGVRCNIYGSEPTFDSGRTDFFVPDNLIIGQGGEIHRPDGNFYKVDFEVGTIVLEIPDGLFGSERTINILDDFISNYTGEGITRLGFPAMKFADCSFVSANALANDQLRFSVSVQSFSPNTNGMSNGGLTGAIVDGKIGVAIDYSTGLLTLNFTNLYQDAVLKTLSTKIQVNVFLKKGGFNNQPVFIDSTKVQNMLKLISVFSGANVGGPSALVNFATDGYGILPIVHGGTGLTIVGATGTVLMSNGSAVSYQFISSSYVTYTASVPGNWAGTAPTTVQAALDRIAAHFPGVI